MSDLIRARVLASWCDSRTACDVFNRMSTAGNYEWDFDDLGGEPRRLRLTWDDDEPDVWVVLNAPQLGDPAAELLDPARTVVFQMEPLMGTDAMRPLWNEWAAPNPQSFLQVRDARYRNSNDWWLGLSYADLATKALPPKDRTMSACVSAKYFDPGHRKRMDFLRFLDDTDLDLDIYGSPDNGFRRFVSPTPLFDKQDALLPYRYAFDAENNAVPNYFTEKIVDCLLAETLCFYWGCPNLDSFIDPRAFIRLELEDFDADLARIRAAIADDEWSERLPYIRAEKARILEDYGFFATLARVVDPVRRSRHWHVGDADRAVVEREIGTTRAGTFVEVSDRTGDPTTSETLDVERRLDWAGLCLEAEAERLSAARAVRDCTVARDDPESSIEHHVRRNGLAPHAIDWLNLAVPEPSALLGDGGRLDPSRVGANLVTMFRASPVERRRCAELLAPHGYEPASADADDAPTALVRPRPTICLSMIVKDEAHVVTEVLDDVAPHIDTWVVVDTGSTDGTPEVVRNFFEARGIPGELHHRPWRDFGINRTEALELCAVKADYAWVIDADDRVVGTPDLTTLGADSYLLRYGDEFTYWRKQIFRLGLGFRYEGAVHEYPVCKGAATEARLEGDYHLESRRLGARSRAADKYERDCRLLHDALAADPQDARSAFYLAQSYRDAGDLERALDWYTRRADMDGWDEETFCARQERARVLERLDAPWEEALAAYLDAWQARPTRAEPLYEIARHYRTNGQYDLGALFAKRAVDIPFPENDNLFVGADVYRWRAADELAICEYYVGEHRESFARCSRLLDEPSLPEAERERILANRDFAVAHLLDDARQYPNEIVERLAQRDAATAAASEVTLTITSCRRLELFEATVNSFLSCCADLEQIGRWVCVDDNSSDEDRARMQARYPFFEFVWKGPHERGHAHSLDRLAGTVTTPYWLHLEDDWLFFAPDRYVTKARAVLEHDPRVGQVLFNRNYGERLDCRQIIGGTVARTSDGVRYRVHDHVPGGTPAHDELIAALPPGGLSNAWWPHFSLRPSLMRAESVRAVAPFERGADHFERDAADRYTERGYVSAFLDAISCLHTGRLTTERSAGGPANAYELNEVPQFGGPAYAPGDLAVRVLNLDRRPDRWQSFVAAATDAVGPELVARCVRVTAVDGAALVATPELENLFRGNDFGWRRSFIGCALSHLALWREAAASDAMTLVFEDDARMRPGFTAALDEVLRHVGDRSDDGTLVVLGYHAVDAAATAGDGQQRLDAMDWGDYVGGTFAYVVSPAAARHLVAAAERDGIRHGVDRFMQYQAGSIRALRCVPRLVDSPLAVSGTTTDSDIQHDFEALVTLPSIEGRTR